MSPRVPSFALAALVSSSLLVGTAPPAIAHGGDEQAGVKALAMQPARILAQQAIAELKIRADADEAAMRLDAALESKEKSGIDVKRLKEATEKLDGGDPEGAVPLLDEALSRPLGSDSGKALHDAGREFQPGTGAPEVVAIIAGALLLLLGALSLLAWRSRKPRTVP